MADNLAWAAGFIDGEGCISISGSVHPGKVSPYHQLRLGVVNTDKTAIEELKRIFSLGSISRKERKGHYKPIYRWNVADYNAAKVLTGILPYLRVKKAEARIALDFIVLRGVTNGSGKVLTDEVVAMREAYRMHLQELKK